MIDSSNLSEHQKTSQYIQTATREVESKATEISFVDGDQIFSYHTDFPFVCEIENPQGEWNDIFSVVTVKPLQGDLHSKVHLERVSYRQGRSHTVESTRGAIWGSKKNGLYACVDIKGNRFEDPVPQISSRAEGFPLAVKYRIFGMFDFRFASKIIIQSKELIEAGVETERLERIVVPTSFYADGKKFDSIKDFREHLIGKALDDPKIKDKKEAIAYIEEFQPMIVIRSLQVPERMDDLITLKSLDQLKRMMRKVFQFVNARSKIIDEGVHFNADSIESIQHYFTDYLPKKLGSNLAKLHNTKHIHGYLHQQNISLVGSIYDLDSITEASLNTLETEYNNVEMSLLISLAKLPIIMMLFPTNSEEFIEIFLENFKRSYEEVRKR